MTTTTPRRASSADDRLTVALQQLASAGERPPCGDSDTSHYWTSDDAGERAAAAHWCHGCPIVAECHAAAVANSERFGVWAGVDRTVAPGRPKRW